MSGTLHGKACSINQCFRPSYDANEKQGQNIFYIVDKSILMPANNFWNAVNAGIIEIKGGKK